MRESRARCTGRDRLSEQLKTTAIRFDSGTDSSVLRKDLTSSAPGLPDCLWRLFRYYSDCLWYVDDLCHLVGE